jgi:hypothetical protein
MSLSASVHIGGSSLETALFGSSCSGGVQRSVTGSKGVTAVIVPTKSA